MATYNIEMNRYNGTDWDTMYPKTSSSQVDGLQSTIDTRISATVFNLIYPVGSIYMSVNSADPSTLFGGTWVQLKDRFLLGVGDTYSTVSNTGGEATHTLTVNEMPSHNHIAVKPLEYNSPDYYAGSVNEYGFTGGSDSSGAGHHLKYTSYSGGGQAHNNMPPYLTVYMWKRTA